MSTRLLAIWTLKAAVVALICWATPIPSHAETAFAGLSGTWSGSGTISFNTGSRERIRCRATYATSDNSTALKLSLTCASDSYKFELSSDLTATGNTIRGTWSENTRQVYGSISGSRTGNAINVTASSLTFTASLSVRTQGNRQSISIRAPDSEMSEVVISLSRR